MRRAHAGRDGVSRHPPRQRSGVRAEHLRTVRHRPGRAGRFWDPGLCHQRVRVCRLCRAGRARSRSAGAGAGRDRARAAHPDATVGRAAAASRRRSIAGSAFPLVVADYVSLPEEDAPGSVQDALGDRSDAPRRGRVAQRKRRGPADIRTPAQRPATRSWNGCGSGPRWPRA